METAPKYSSTCISIVKIITTVLFIVLPFLGFFLGMNYQTSVTESAQVPTTLVRKPTPTPKQGIVETANWKTYENKKLKFELKYPDKNSEVIECESETIFIAPIERHFDPCQSSGGRFWIRAEEINYKLPDWYYRDYNIQTQKVLIASREATKYAGTRSSKEIAPIPQSFYAIVIKTEERTIVINVQTYTGSQTLNDRLIDQILSTFKFADQNQIDETSNWKTYTNEKLHFSFQYPDSWESTKIPPDNFIVNNLLLQTLQLPKCTLYLQNKLDPTSIIVIDANKSDSYCWSRGYFYDHFLRSATYSNLERNINVSKWSSRKTNDNSSWKNDLFETYYFFSSINFGLLHKTNENSGVERVFDQILSTFKFIE